MFLTPKVSAAPMSGRARRPNDFCLETLRFASYHFETEGLDVFQGVGKKLLKDEHR
jgi:hypothetical protein